MNGSVGMAGIDARQRQDTFVNADGKTTPNADADPPPFFVPGDVLALLAPIQDLEPGLYLLHAMTQGWAVMRWLIDDEEGERILVTEREYYLPATLLQLFVSVGLRLSSAA